MIRFCSSKMVRLFLVPTLLYGGVFVVLTYPLILQFSSAIWSGSPDGWQSIWNLWWINKSVMMLHQLPWFTTEVHFPYGISLWGHSFEAIDGFLAIPLASFFSFIQIYNALLLVSFVLGGLTMFWLAYILTRAYLPSLTAGYIFAFSNYHLAQARSHLNLMSVQWIPLFVLFWYLLLEKVERKFAFAAAITLGIIALTDYYFLFYCVLAAFIMTLWKIWQSRAILRQKEYYIAFGVFVLALCVFVIPFVAPLVVEFSGGSVQGHDAEMYSLDLFGILIPGKLWYFASLTRQFWQNWSGNPTENNVALGIAAIVMLMYVWIVRRKLGRADVTLWFLLGAVFWCLSLGPVLHINGVAVPFVTMPYTLLAGLIPALSLSGIPLRMMVMVTLSASVLWSFGFQRLAATSRRALAIGILLLITFIVETLPKPFPTMLPAVPPYVQALGVLPSGGVIDWVGMDPAALQKGIPPGQMMFYQTIHQKPIAFGYIARVPKDTAQQDSELWAAILERRVDVLCRRFHLRYFVGDAKAESPAVWDDSAAVYHDQDVIIYDMKTLDECNTAANP